jgi:ribosomal-protein-alanine N-acetyltransferase
MRGEKKVYMSKKIKNMVTTNRLIMKDMKEEDGEILYKYWSDNEVTKYMNITPFHKVEQAKEMIQFLTTLKEEGKAARYSIFLKKSGELIGTCGFNSIDNENSRVEIGYDLGKNYWGHGYIREALTALIQEAFLSLHMNRIEAKVEVENENSIKALSKLAFTNEGRLRQYERSKGKLIDVYMFSLLKEEFHKLEES